MAMAFDFNSMLVIIIVVVVIIFMFPVIKWIIELLQKRQQMAIYHPQDLHGAIFKKNKLAAKANMRGTSVRYLYAMGNKDTRPIRWARIRGIIWGRDCIQVYFTFGRLPVFWRWAIIPKEVIHDQLGKVLRVRCACFRGLGNFYTPVYLSEESEANIHKMQQEVKDFEQWLMNEEWCIEMSEQSVDSQTEAIGCRTPAVRPAGREDTVEADSKREVRPQDKESQEAL